MTKKPEIYVSMDIEADGPCPILNSMLSLGAAAFDPSRGPGKAGLIATWEANFDLQPGAVPDPNTMAWWGKKPQAWYAHRQNTRPADEAIPAFVEWVEALPGKPIAVCYPLGFDFTWVYVLCHRYAGRSPFGFSGLDVKSYAAGMLGGDFSAATKKNFPRAWFDKSLKHTHKALDDATEQGVMIMSALAARCDLEPPRAEDASPFTVAREADLRAWLVRHEPGSATVGTIRELLAEITRLREKKP